MGNHAGQWGADGEASTNTPLLFDSPFADRGELRRYARLQVESSPLIQACCRSDVAAVQAFKVGFWPFVRDFGNAIDTHPFPLRPLFTQFGRERTRRYLALISGSVKAMAREEGEHAHWWREAALDIEISLADDAKPLTSVDALLSMTNDKSMFVFLCHLAGTEYIAEELSRVLCASTPFLNLFQNCRWSWGDAHLMAHEGPSHLDIDEDLACAFGIVEFKSDDCRVREEMMRTIKTTEDAFFTAADEIYRTLLPHVHTSIAAYKAYSDSKGYEP
jgi:hypothetical protein